MGHTDPAFSLRVYAQVMRLSEKERSKLAAIVEFGHSMDTNRDTGPGVAVEDESPDAENRF